MPTLNQNLYTYHNGSPKDQPPPNQKRKANSRAVNNKIADAVGAWRGLID